MSEPVQWLNNRAEGKFIDKVAGIKRRINFVKDENQQVQKSYRFFRSVIYVKYQFL